MFKRFVYQCSHNEPNELTQCVFQGLEVSNTSHLVSNERRNSDVAFKKEFRLNNLLIDRSLSLCQANQP